MSRIVVTVCDVCESQDGVVSYEMKRKGAKGRSVQRDLCEKHKAPLESVLAGVAAAPSKPPAKKAAAKKSTARKRVTTLKEIEALKAK